MCREVQVQVALTGISHASPSSILFAPFPFPNWKAGLDDPMGCGRGRGARKMGEQGVNTSIAPFQIHVFLGMFLLSF